MHRELYLDPEIPKRNKQKWRVWKLTKFFMKKPSRIACGLARHLFLGTKLKLKLSKCYKIPTCRLFCQDIPRAWSESAYTWPLPHSRHISHFYNTVFQLLLLLNHQYGSKFIYLLFLDLRSFLIWLYSTLNHNRWSARRAPIINDQVGQYRRLIEALPEPLSFVPKLLMFRYIILPHIANIIHLDQSNYVIIIKYSL